MKLNIKAKVSPFFDTVANTSLVDPIERLNDYDISCRSNTFVLNNWNNIVCKINNDYIMMWLGHMLSQSVKLKPCGFMIEHPNISYQWNGHVLKIEIDVFVNIDEGTTFGLYFQNEHFIKTLLVELFDGNSIIWGVRGLNQSNDLITHRLISRVDERQIDVNTNIDFGDLFNK